ncbi:MAG: hypothetical protein ACRD3E_09120 [Terriglobales bacterium]
MIEFAKQRLSSKLVVHLFALVSIGVLAAAQDKPSTPPPAANPAAADKPKQAAPAAAKIDLEPDEKAYQAAAHIADPMERADALVKLVADYPTYPYIGNVVYVLFRDPKMTLRELQEPQKRDPVATKAVVERFVAGTTSAPAYARTEFYYEIAKNLAGSDLLLDTAADLARKAVPLLNEKDYLDNERRMLQRKELYARRRDPTAKVDVFPVEEARAHYQAFAAAINATLGSVLLKTGDLDGATRAFQDANKIEPIMEAMTGLSDIAERRGNIADALKYLMDAALTGKLAAAKIKHLDELYAGSHGGSAQGLQADLDDIYRVRFSTPLHPDPYQAPNNRAKRVVLAEFVTGAGCEPCTSVDLAFDAELKRYDRDELALIVYHMHAPHPDPMSNASAEERLKFYDVHGAPVVFLDGERVHPGDGMKSEAVRVFDALDKRIENRLNTPEAAQIDLAAKLAGAGVKVEAALPEFENTGNPLRLMIALVENQVSYSGENGLRFHPMVVRNLATPIASGPAGFAIEPGNNAAVQYTFNLMDISATNLKYYDSYAADLFKRVGMKVSFKEERYVIDPNKLSVVAFVQDQVTKKVLQSAYVRVAPQQNPAAAATH